MKLLPFLSTTTQSNSSSSSSSSEQQHHPRPPPSPWQWAGCAHLETLSFRATTVEYEATFKSLQQQQPSGSEDTIEASNVDMVMTTESPLSCFTNSSTGSSTSFSMRSEESVSDHHIETVIRGLRSDHRLFFEPGESNSILEEANKAATSRPGTRTTTGVGRGLINPVPYKESVFLSMESKDPFVDFRASMEEMIEAHGLNDWDCLEELLGWYLKVNGQGNHGYIIGAFVDLLVSLSSSSSSSSVPQSAPLDQRATPMTVAMTMTSSSSSSSSSSSFSCTCSPSSPLSLPSSSLTTPCLSSLDQVDEDDYENGEETSHLPS